MVTIYLWESGSWCGVSSELDRAQLAVADLLPAGYGRFDAIIEQARAGLLTSVPESTGFTWTPWRRPDGSVCWWPSYRLEAA